MTANSECRLADGRAVVLRQAGPGDIAAITRLYLELSPQSFYLRFHSHRPAPARVARLASLGSGTACLVAAAPADPDRLAAEAAACASTPRRRSASAAGRSARPGEPARWSPPGGAGSPRRQT
jgi:hypothetical protein